MTDLQTASGSRYILGLDIGTSRVRALIAEILHVGKVQVLGVGTHPCRGLRRGEIVKIDDTVSSIQMAVEQAENMAGIEIADAWIGLSGGQIAGINARAAIAVNNPSRGVTEADKKRVLKKVEEEKLSEGYELLHSIPQEYDIDSRKGIIEPLGLTTKKLWVSAHLVEVENSVICDFTRCVRKAGLDVRGLTLQSLAAARAVLYSEEMESGVLLVDIGGGTTDYAVFRDGYLRHTGVIGVGGDHISNDISIGLHIQLSKAEKTKIEYASVLEPEPQESDSCPVTPGMGETTTKISRRKLHLISRVRVEELFLLIKADLEKEGIFGSLASGMVLTGGGSKLSGINELARATLGLKVRSGIPWGLDRLEGVVDEIDYSTVVGLVKYGAYHAPPPGGVFRPWIIFKKVIARYL